MVRTRFQPGPAQDHYHDTLGVTEAVGGSLTVGDGINPPAVVTTIVASGAVVVGDTATLGDNVDGFTNDATAEFGLNSLTASGDYSANALLATGVEASNLLRADATDGFNHLHTRGTNGVNIIESGSPGTLTGVPLRLRRGIIDGVRYEADVLVGEAAPSAGAGVISAFLGSLYIRTTGELWIKTGAGDTAWTKLAVVP